MLIAYACVFRECSTLDHTIQAALNVFIYLFNLPENVVIWKKEHLLTVNYVFFKNLKLFEFAQYIFLRIRDYLILTSFF